MRPTLTAFLVALLTLGCSGIFTPSVEVACERALENSASGALQRECVDYYTHYATEEQVESLHCMMSAVDVRSCHPMGWDSHPLSEDHEEPEHIATVALQLATPSEAHMERRAHLRDILGGGDDLGSAFGGIIPAAGPSVTMGTPTIAGAMDQALIDNVIKRHMNQIRYCYQRELTKKPDIAGSITITFTIAADGDVTQAEVSEDTTGVPAVSSCIQGRFMRMTFPEPSGGGTVSVTYPMTLSPS